MEHVEEQSGEYEMRDSAGYIVPHTGKDLYMVYSLRANNTLNSNRLEMYLQDTWRFKSGGRESNDKTWSMIQRYTRSTMVSASLIGTIQESLSSLRVSP